MSRTPTQPGKLRAAERQVLPSAGINDHDYGLKLSRKAMTPSDELDGPYIKLKIQNTTVYMLLDTGSNCTILTQKAYSELEDKPTLCYTEAEIAVTNGGIVKSVGYANFKIQIGDIELIHKIYVADIRAGNLLGSDFVRQQGCKIDGNKNVLQVKHVDLPLLECEFPLQCYWVNLARTIELAPESEMVISGRILGIPEEAET